MIELAEACSVTRESSPWLRTIWASWALVARRDYGLANGERAGFSRFLARRQGATAQRTDLLSLDTVDTLLWAALCALVEPEEAE